METFGDRLKKVLSERNYKALAIEINSSASAAEEEAKITKILIS